MVSHLFLVGAGSAACCAGYMFYMLRRALQKLTKISASSPVAFLASRANAPPGRRTLVCVGDSNTHALLAGNYVGYLQEALGQLWVCVNAGVGGDTIECVDRRLHDIIKCAPDVVTLMIGTNDFRRIYFYQEPTFEHCQVVYRRVLQRLLKETSAKILCLSVPMLSEDLGARSNLDCALPGNTDIAQVVANMTDARVRYVDANALMTFELHRHITSGPPRRRPPALDSWPYLYIKTAVFHYLFGVSLDRIASWHGMWLLVDCLHTNDRGARLIAEDA